MPEKIDRKNSHIDICLNEAVEFSAEATGSFECLRFDHDALPEVDKADIDLTVEIFGKKLSAPVMVGAMTGGTDRAGEINKRLAKAAEKCGVGFALGSQRKMLENESARASYAVRESAPNLRLLIGNIGAVQLNYGVTAKQIRNIVKDIGCDAFNFHLNPLQEAIQPEGDTRFSGLLEKLKYVIPEIGVPVLFKEVGSGISETTAKKIQNLPLAGIETAGTGGTSWSKIESFRTSSSIQKSTGELFANWGIPTPESIVICRKYFPNAVVVASGGLRNGIDAAKSIALGANVAAFALPFLKAAEKSTDAVEEAIERIIEELRTSLFVTGCTKVSDLRHRNLRKPTERAI